MTRPVQDEQETPPHECARCRTPYGISQIPCPNATARRMVLGAALAAADRITHRGRITR